MRTQFGFTLIETVIAMSIATTLAGIAISTCQDAVAASRSGYVKAVLVADWLGGLKHAANAGTEVVLCPGDVNGCRTSVDWSDGWIVFADTDGNRTRSPDEALLHAEARLPNKVHLRSTPGRTKLVFQPNGGNAGSNLTWTLCDARGAAKASTIVIANNGRIRVGTPTASAATACMQAI